MINLDSILKSRDITLPTKVRLVKAMVFPIVMYGCESWTVKKAEHRRIDAFELWFWRRLLRVPWTARRSDEFILKPISPEYSLEGLILKKNKMLSRLVITFLPRNMSFNFMVAVTICSDFGAPQNSLSLFPLFSHLFAMK